MYSGVKLSALDYLAMDIQLNFPKGLEYVSKLSTQEITKELDMYPMTAVLLKRHLETK